MNCELLQAILIIQNLQKSDPNKEPYRKGYGLNLTNRRKEMTQEQIEPCGKEEMILPIPDIKLQWRK